MSLSSEEKNTAYEKLTPQRKQLVDKEWRGLASILGEWFKAKEVPQLAQTINDWRNELAHANCKFVPTRDVITAVRLLECVNYCIIFRCAGYDDMEIKTYIEDAALLR